MNRTSYSWLMLAAIVLLSGLLVFLLYVGNTDYVIVNVLSLTLFIAFFCIIYRRFQYVFLVLLPFSFSHFSAIVSNVSIETGSYIDELKVFSYATGGSTRLIFFMLSFFFIAMLTYAFLNKYRVNRFFLSLSINVEKLEKQTVVLAVGCVVLILIGVAFMWGTPLSQGVQRFEYWRELPYPALRSFLYQGYFLGFIFGVYIAKNKIKGSGRTGFYVLSVALFCVLNVLFGEKFTGIFLTLLYCFIGYSATMALEKHIKLINAKSVLLMAFMFLMLLFLIYYQYKYVHKISGDVLGFIKTRILTLQGEVWWATDSLSAKGTEPAYLFSNTGDCRTTGGLYYLMYKIAPLSLVESYCERGITFSMGYPAIMIPTVGYLVGYFLNLVFAMIIGVTLFLMRKAIENSNVVSLFLSVKVLLIETHSFNMGNLYNVFETKFLIYFLLLIFFSELRLKNAQVGSNVLATISSNKSK